MKPLSKFRLRLNDQCKNQFTTPERQYNLPEAQKSNDFEVATIEAKRSHSKISKPESKLYRQLLQKLDAIETKVEQTKASIYRKNLQRTKKNVLRSQEFQEIKRNFKNKEIESKTAKQRDLILPQQTFGNQKNNMQTAQQEEVKRQQNLDKNRERQDLQDFLTQQKPMKLNTLYEMHETLNGLVTNMSEGPYHSFEKNPYSPRNNKYYVSEAIKGYQDKTSVVWEHLRISISLFNYFSQTRIPKNNDIKKRAVDLQLDPRYIGKKTVIFDLDETLIHCNENIKIEHQVELPVKLPNGEMVVGINIRPGAIEILQALHQQFELVVFTASHSCYANAVVDYLDPQKQYIQHRLYRQHCYVTPNGEYVKDLRIINRELKNMVLVDNAAYSYAFQPENGIPIIPYYHGDKDFELKMLEQYIKKLSLCPDVRVVNRETFKLTKYREFRPNQVEKLVESLYIPKTF